MIKRAAALAALALLVLLSISPEAAAIAAVHGLRALGLAAWREGLLIGQGTFVAEIHWSCTAAVLAAPLLAARALLWRRDLLGVDLAWCHAALGGAWLLNQARLVGLAWVGVHMPEHFGWAHGIAAPLAMVVCGAAFLLATRPPRRGHSGSAARGAPAWQVYR